MKRQIILEARRFLVLSNSILQDVETDVETAEIIAPTRFGSRVHIAPNKKLEKFVGEIVAVNVDYNYPTPEFLFAAELMHI